MNIDMQILPHKHRLRILSKIVKTSVTLHSTANPRSTAQNERDWLDNPSNKREASWHFVVDEKQIVQALPTTETSMHCGNFQGNRYSISVEICESGDRAVTLENASEFVAFILKTNNLKLSDIKLHHDWSGKNCPRILVDKRCIVDGLDLRYFLGRVEFYYNREEDEEMIRYNNLSEILKDMPYAKETMQKLINFKMFADNTKLDLSSDMIRNFIFNDRLGVYKNLK